MGHNAAGPVIRAELAGLDLLVASGALARRGRRPAVTIAAFDLLWLEGHDISPIPDRERRRLLEGLELPGVTLLPRFAAVDVGLLIGCCDDLGVEGLVLKQTEAVYRPGRRSSSWRKVKVPAWREFHQDRRRPR